MKNNEFYDNLSEEYDSMLDFNKLAAAREEALKKFIRSGYKSAMDIGCGTGADSIALTKNGLKVAGYDTSSRMIRKARLNAKKRKLDITFSNSPVQKISKNKHPEIDIVVSLGNAIANINPRTLDKIFYKVYKLLNPGGSFLIQILNYKPLRKSNKRIVNITRGNGNIFIRFYDFEKNGLRFNIFTAKEKSLKEYNLITTELYEYKKKEISGLLKRNGFSKIKYYSDLNKSIFRPNVSKDLIILAEK